MKASASRLGNILRTAYGSPETTGACKEANVSIYMCIQVKALCFEKLIIIYHKIDAYAL